MPNRPARIIALALLTLTACQDRGPTPDLATVTGPIVNGQLETGWLGVGALTATYPFYGYQGAFCTGTLIASDWVLTAAHCTYEEDGSVIQASNTRFFVGSDARPSSTVNGPTNGTLYTVDGVYPHPQYNDTTLANDIALIHLSQIPPTASVARYGVNTAFPTAGTTATYVGFGATEGVNSTGSGVKRITTFPISYVYPNEGSYTSDFTTTGTCFGDSGGPGLQQIGGVWKVVGVTSAGLGCNPQYDPNCDPDPCRRATIHTRVDWYASWIAQMTNTAAPTCQQNPAMCACAEACQTNGQCNNAVCQTAGCEDAYTCIANCTTSTCQNSCYDSATAQAQGQLDALFTCLDQYCSNATEATYGQCANQYCANQVNACFPVGTGPWTCREVYSCLAECTDSTCGNTCYEQGTAVAQDEIDALLTCLDSKCGTLSGDAYQNCASQQCGSEIDTCFPTLTGDASCEEVADCIVACPDSDANCPYGCYETGTAQAQGQYDALLDCAQTQCGTLSGSAFTSCYQEKCVPQLDACFPPANCPITGGGCPSGEACYPVVSGATDCFPSAGLALGAACADSSTTLACGDGLVCDGGSCQKFCRLDANCGANAVCKTPVEPMSDGIGVCGCRDDDGDGSCFADDCNDQNAATHPGAAEACGDSVDNDCNGQTDEGCSVCVDGDQDGYCVGSDCNDADATVHPQAGERCGDNVDNDCDGQTDEDCATCTDFDQDGYCASVDCNDQDAAIHPGAAEVCGDDQDNNCSGARDEGCGTIDPGTDPITTPGTHSGDSGCSGGSPVSGLLGLGLGLLALLAWRRRPGFGGR